MTPYLRWRRLRFRLHVLADRIYEATHAPLPDPADEAWADQLHQWNSDPESLGGAFYKDGVLVRRTWAGLIRVERAVA